ncbi:MAG: SIMPL domain-containing protein [Parvularculaceae bacterium]|nr:SIMPL domain-containing protein [Parvularculaceae bacterium]
MRTKIVAAALGATLLSGCLPAEKQSFIRIKGRAEIERTPDNVTIVATIRGRGTTREASLAAGAAALKKIQSTAPALKGLKKVRLTSTDANVSTTRGRDCDEYNVRADCPLVGYLTSFKLTLVASPAAVAGPAFSLLSELGAEEVEVVEYGLDDPEAVREAAVKAAVEDARRKAEVIAAASGATITKLASANFGTDDYDSDVVPELEPSNESAPRYMLVSPKIEVTLAPAPIKTTVEVTAAFEIE